ncbi:MAG: hypothetical protein WC421_09625 [Elusimicrobiales bacterium]
MNELFLKIAGIVTRLSSRFPLSEETSSVSGGTERLADFITTARSPDIEIRVIPVRALPSPPRSKPLFNVLHPGDNNPNWRLFRRGAGYVYQCPLKGKRQIYFINRGFNRVSAYLKAAPGCNGWLAQDIVYDFLQVLMVHYMAERGSGIIIHAAGVRDGARGFVFPGESGAGKSTISRLWHAAGALAINDDRVIIRRARAGFEMHSSPWHGDFFDYTAQYTRPVKISSLFFIRHGRTEYAVPLSAPETFMRLYPALFPVFWDRRLQENQLGFMQKLSGAVRAFALHFAPRRKALDFIRGL